MVNKQDCQQKSAANVYDIEAEHESLKQTTNFEKQHNTNVLVGGNISINTASNVIANRLIQQQQHQQHQQHSHKISSSSDTLLSSSSTANASASSSLTTTAATTTVSTKSSPPNVNYARNAAAANNHKLIPIQSVLKTAADAHNHRTHIDQKHQHHHHPNNHQHQHQHKVHQEQQQEHYKTNLHNPQRYNTVVNKTTTIPPTQQPTTTKSFPLQQYQHQQKQQQQQDVTNLHIPTSSAQQLLVGATTHAQLPTEMPHEDEERLEKLFKQLDRDGNGRIDIHDLSEALREFGLSSVYAEKFLEHSDKTQSGDVGLAEFVHYIREHEKNLRLQFSHLDKNRDGKVDLEELISAFKDLGLEVDVDEAKHLLSRMDQDGSLNISFNEWRDFLLLAPSTDIHDLIKFWRHSTDFAIACNSLILDQNPFILMSFMYSSPLNITNQGPENVQYLDIGEDMNVPDDFTQIELQSGMWWRHLAAGGIAGAVSRTCTAPLDRIKVYLQVQIRKTGISDSFRYMLQEGGVRSMWRGNGINVLKIAPESAIKFAAYEKIKRLIRGDEKRQMSIGERFMAGAAAGGISQTAIYPMEVLKTRLALRKTGQYTGIVDAAKKIYTNEGVRSFYRGYIPNILGIVPYAGIDLAVYETLKKKYLSCHNTEQPSFLVLLACGSASSTLGQVCSYPLALVRTRLQAQVVTKTTDATLPMGGIPLKQAASFNNDDNMFGVFRKILQTEGVCGLYRGITPNFIKVLPAVSISYVVYEYVSRGLGVNMT